MVVDDIVRVCANLDYDGFLKEEQDFKNQTPNYTEKDIANHFELSVIDYRRLRSFSVLRRRYENNRKRLKK